MSQHWAVMWTIKPGTEEAVEELFSNYGTPDHIFRGEDGSEQGRLVGTQVYMKGNTVVRVMEFEGDHRALVQHLQRQPVVRELERKLDDYLETPRDMSTPEGAQKFFRETAMRCLLARRHEE
jgi:SchA/CurD like domain-containing protein